MDGRAGPGNRHTDRPPNRTEPPREGARPGHARRRAARRQAIDVLYQADVTGRPPAEVLEQWRAAGRNVQPYAAELVAGVDRDLSDLDALLGRYSEDWTVARMATVDRTILRVACHELRSGVPAPVAISEAVEAANQLSTEDSGRFVNGILGKIARTVGWDLPNGPTSGGESGPAS